MLQEGWIDLLVSYNHVVPHEDHIHNTKLPLSMPDRPLHYFHHSIALGWFKSFSFVMNLGWNENAYSFSGPLRSPSHYNKLCFPPKLTSRTTVFMNVLTLNMVATMK